MGRVHVAPMMGRTHQVFRRALRYLSPHLVLYTEMVADKAIGKHSDLRALESVSQPEWLQLGTEDPNTLYKALCTIDTSKFTGIDLNIGCPSTKVEKGNFGVILMRDVPRIVSLIHAAQQATSLPVSIKCRLGIVGDSPTQLLRLLYAIQALNVHHITVHARKAILGKSPKINRNIPPLHYDFVYALASAFPQCTFVINGGIHTVEDIQRHFIQVSQVMIGRAFWQNPYGLTKDINHILYQESILSRYTLLQHLVCDFQENPQGLRALAICMHGLFYTTPYASKWHQWLHRIGSEPNQKIGKSWRALLSNWDDLGLH